MCKPAFAREKNVRGRLCDSSGTMRKIIQALFGLLVLFELGVVSLDLRYQIRKAIEICPGLIWSNKLAICCYSTFRRWKTPCLSDQSTESPCTSAVDCADCDSSKFYPWWVWTQLHYTVHRVLECWCSSYPWLGVPQAERTWQDPPRIEYQSTMDGNYSSLKDLLDDPCALPIVPLH
jgi:hypothetical protein